MVEAILSPSVAALRNQFDAAILRHQLSCGDTIVYVAADRAHEILAWLKDEAGPRCN